MMGLNSAELFAKKAGTAMPTAVKWAPLLRKIQAAREAYGTQATRKPATIRMHMRVTSLSAFWVDSDSCCWAAAYLWWKRTDAKRLKPGALKLLRL